MDIGEKSQLTAWTLIFDRLTRNFILSFLSFCFLMLYICAVLKDVGEYRKLESDFV